MARPLHFSQPPPGTSQTALAAVSLLLCVFALFACASHSRKSRRWRACYEFLELEDEPVIELNNEVMLQSPTEFQEYQLRDDDQSGFSGEQQGVPIWQKNIIMGGKCQLPDFSGVIIYDSEGNVVTPAKPQLPLLTWK
ncbi:F14O23.12 [Citrus sinensis]|uniref:Uncharacterized protein n=2 Tax=Citrus sinensis TaxID=2711 RepID=A0A067DCJ2_CITSI|nr:F14O23.12 [Citrus sinensis]KDO36361.1 hypothetical protein CISIN_1g048595mg [Citrus sinensis]